MPDKSPVRVRNLRFPGESETEFRARVERTACFAKMLIDGALANARVREFIDDPALPYSIESVRNSPDVRVEYAEAFAIGDIFGCLRATRSKHWGEGPYVRPLQPDDPVDPMRLLYLYRANSRYHRRFDQRRRLKELLGRRYRSLVGRAQRRTRSLFLDSLTDGEIRAIGRVLKIDAIQFWRAVKGRRFLDLPARLIQLEFDFEE